MGGERYNRRDYTTKIMRVSTITKLTKIVENTRDKEAFKVRLEYFGVKDQDKLRLIWKVYKLVHFTNFFTEEIREALRKGGKYEQIAKKYDIPFNSLKTEVYLQCRDLLGVMKRDIVRDILEGKEVSEKELKDAELIIDDLLVNRDVDIDDFRETCFTIDLFKIDYTNEDFSDISREDFINIRNMLVYFSKPSQKFIYKNMEERLKKYVAYLLDSPESKLSEEDRERREELLTFSKIIDYIDN